MFLHMQVDWFLQERFDMCLVRRPESFRRARKIIMPGSSFSARGSQNLAADFWLAAARRAMAMVMVFCLLGYSGLYSAAPAAAAFGGFGGGGGGPAFISPYGFNDTETSLDNFLSATSLDIALDYSHGSDFSPSVSSAQSASRSISVVNSGSLNFQYSVSAGNFSGDAALCAALQLQSSRHGTSFAAMPLQEFAAATSTYDSLAGDWQFAASLPGEPDAFLQNKVCSFNLIFTAWQTDAANPEDGFYDIETMPSSVSSGSWTEPAAESPAPVYDSYVYQKNSNAADNYGSSQDLYINSKNGQQNQRIFIGFNFNFPSGTNISSSKLKLYMSSAPALPRVYEAYRAAGSWTESGINWNNQPAASSTPTASVGSGSSAGWLAWDVTSDVAAFASGTPNYGWLLKDGSEDYPSGAQAKFVSRDSSATGTRPYLEINFTSPPASTGHLVINEVYANVAPDKGDASKGEWLEIYNPTDSAVNLSGWEICDNSSCDILPGSPVIPSRSFVVVTPDASVFNAHWTLPAGAQLVDIGSDIGNGLSNSGDRVVLRDGTPGHAIVDAMSYGNDASYFVLPQAKPGVSYARIVKGYDNDVSSDWVMNAAPNPGTNPSQGGSEVMRFTADGIMVAADESGLPPVQDPTVAGKPFSNEEAGQIDSGQDAGSGTQDREDLSAGNASTTDESLKEPSGNSTSTADSLQDEKNNYDDNAESAGQGQQGGQNQNAGDSADSGQPAGQENSGATGQNSEISGDQLQEPAKTDDSDTNASDKQDVAEDSGGGKNQTQAEDSNKQASASPEDPPPVEGAENE